MANGVLLSRVSFYRRAFRNLLFVINIEEMAFVHVEGQIDMVTDVNVASGVNLGDDVRVANRDVDVGFSTE